MCYSAISYHCSTSNLAPANGLTEETKDGPSIWAPATPVGDAPEAAAGTFSLAQFWPLSRAGSELVELKHTLPLSLFQIHILKRKGNWHNR